MTAVATGTATDYKNLLSLLRTFLTTHTDLVNASPSQTWTEMRWDTPDEYELIVKGPGLAGDDEIYVGIQTYKNEGEDYYNWRLQGFTGYLAGAAFDLQPGAIANTPPSLALHNNAIPYWFVATGRRFVVVARVSSVYEACYLGFLMPFGTPSQLPYPLTVGGSIIGGTNSGYRYSTQMVSHRQFVSPGAYGTSNTDSAINFSSTLMLLHGDWIALRNYYGISGEGAQSRLGCETWPYGDSLTNDTWALMRNNMDGSYPGFPIQAYQETPGDNVFGELEGCLAVPGFGLAAEDIITIGGVSHLVIPNVYRSGASDWWALALE